jgi:hypothetical protein
MRTIQFPRAEPVTRTGEVLLSHNHIALLHGLYDRPSGLAQSSRDFIHAALPYVELFRPGASAGVIHKSLRSLHPAWVTRERVGRCVTWKITAKGRAILERSVPARIKSHGLYQGLAPYRARVALERNPEVVEARWLRAVRNPAFAVLTAAAEALVVAWSRQDNRIGMGHSLQKRHQRGQLSLYVRRYVLLNGSLPSGPHVIARGLCVEFDELRLAVG